MPHDNDSECTNVFLACHPAIVVTVTAACASSQMLSSCARASEVRGEEARTDGCCPPRVGAARASRSTVDALDNVEAELLPARHTPIAELVESFVAQIDPVHHRALLRYAVAP